MTSMADIIEKTRLQCKFLSLTRQLCLPLVPSEVTKKHIEDLTEALKDDPDLDIIMGKLLGVRS